MGDFTLLEAISQKGCEFTTRQTLFISNLGDGQSVGYNKAVMAKQNRNSQLDKQSDLAKIRHSASHVLAEAVLRLYPDAKPAIGPAIEDGFYYDFDFAQPLQESDLAKIEKEMRKILKEGRHFEMVELQGAEAADELRTNDYKWEILHGEVGLSSDAKIEKEKISFCVSQPTNPNPKHTVFRDMCRGGHVEDSSEIGAIKLLRLAGAYWRGDEKNKMLTRIYGTAFATQAELDEYLAMLEEAKKRDHRKLGQELDLFTFSDLVGAGLPLFTPKGTLMRELIVDKIQKLQAEYGYQRVTIPHITKKDLYETSGHWDKFKDDLFHVRGKSEQEFVMKPMNCPHHTQLYASRPRSYRDLPIRFMETTMVYRDEQQGELLGLARVRSISQDDGHVFCTLEQTEEEVRNIVRVIKSFYADLGMLNEGDYWVSLSVRDAQTPDKYLGDPANWEMAEKMLESVAKAEQLDYHRVEGEAAFYGPKLDFMFKDSLGRERQLGTAQVDFVMPERFGLEYTDTDGLAKRPVMIHRAIAGSLERFMAIMIEHFAGAFPLWLAPVQAKVLTIGSTQAEYASQVFTQLREAGLRVELDDRNESIGKKIRESEMAKVPYMLVIGEKEAAAGWVAVRSHTKDDLGAMETAKFIQMAHDEISSKA